MFIMFFIMFIYYRNFKFYNPNYSIAISRGSRPCTLENNKNDPRRNTRWIFPKRYIRYEITNH